MLHNTLQLVSAEEMQGHIGNTIDAVIHPDLQPADALALAIIAIGENYNIRFCVCDDELELDKLSNKGAWLIGVGGKYDPERQCFDPEAINSKSLTIGCAAVLLWDRYGESICSRYCSTEEEQQGLPSDAARNINLYLGDIVDADDEFDEITLIDLLRMFDPTEREGNDPYLSHEDLFADAFYMIRVLLPRVVAWAVQDVRKEAAEQAE